MSRRIELGLEGGGALVLTVDDADITILTAQLAGERGWISLSAEEGEHTIDAARVLYVRILPGEANSRIGFRESA
ncbi:MAG: hypothetical protein EXQ74_01305 [Thermoleophilia bacterium]|nr:hypothetical protein [Thermoleophilia bacterium]